MGRQDGNGAEGKHEPLDDRSRKARGLQILGFLAGSVAHDFNNLLMGMLGNADLALAKLPPGSPARENLAGIRDSSQRAADLCRQLLALSGRERKVVEPLDLCGVVREIAGLLELSAGKSAALEYDLPPSVPPFEGDRTEIQQAVVQMVLAGAEAGPGAKGFIELRAGVTDCDRDRPARTHAGEDLPEGSYVWLEIANHGAVLEEKILAGILDPSFAESFPGHGPGLSAVAAIARGHGGAIQVESGPGRGTGFRILLPASGGAEKPARSGRTKKGRRKLEGTALIVDDERAVLEVARRMLEQLGLTVIAALGGTEAVELFRQRAAEIDVVVLDLNMPGMNGEETLNALRAANRQIPIILTSGYDEREISGRFRADVMPEAFLQKPFTVTALGDKLEQFLGR